MEVVTIPLGPLLLARGTIDRAAALRDDATWLAHAWADATSRVLFVHEGHTLIQQRPDGAALVLGSPLDVPPSARPTPAAGLVRSASRRGKP